MPNVLRNGPYRCFFYAGVREEPPHVHIERDVNVAKVWLDPVRLAGSGGFRSAEIGRIQRPTRCSCTKLLRSWDEFFND